LRLRRLRPRFELLLEERASRMREMPLPRVEEVESSGLKGRQRAQKLSYYSR